MPGLDGTGPNGKGPKTGRGDGLCPVTTPTKKRVLGVGRGGKPFGGGRGNTLGGRGRGRRRPA